MSWYRAIIFGGVLIALQACGFQPLYQHEHQQGQVGVSAGGALQTIRIKPINDRVGQELRNHLFDALTPRGQPADPQWDLKIKLSEVIEHISVEQTSFATRANLKLTGTYFLSPVGDSEQDGHSGTVKVISSYNFLDSEYATLVAERDARSRAVLILSNDIRRQLAIWFNNQ